MMVVAARTQKSCLVPVALGNVETQHVAVEAQRPVDVRDLQMDVSDIDTRVDRPGHPPSLRAGARERSRPSSSP